MLPMFVWIIEWRSSAGAWRMCECLIRALRGQRVDLQKRVHEETCSHFSAYPNNWKLKRPRTNIDHRPRSNLETRFQRQNKALPVTDKYSDYQPGDIVSRRLDNGLAHIGVVSLNRHA